MGKTIKRKEVIAYKGMEFNMTCKGFHYEVGKSYKTDKAKLCEWGFHACLNPRDVLDYYYQEESSRYFKVKLSGEITKCDEFDTKVAATEMTILEEIDIKEAIKTEWWKNENVLDFLYFSDGFARMKRTNGDWNFVNKQGNYLFNKWFYYLGNFNEGLARVARTNGEWNFIDKKGNYLFNEWFYYLENFNEGLAKVRRSDDLWNFINKQGNIVSDKWFNDANSFNDGFAIVEREDGLWNYIDKNGKLLSDEWFMYVFDFNDGFAGVKRTNCECCKIDKSGKLYKD